MSSVNTNVSASVALRALSNTDSEVGALNKRVSTGNRISEAKDNAAYWSIATTMRSDVGALSAVKDALNLGDSAAHVAATATTEIGKLVDEVKRNLITAREPGTDKGKIQANIGSLQSRMVLAANSAKFAGGNWLTIDSTSGQNIDKDIVASVARDASGAIGVLKINVMIYDSATGETLGMLDDNPAAAAKAGLLDKQYATPSGSTFSVSTLDISQLGDSASDLAVLDSMITATDTVLGRVQAAATTIGGVKSRLDMQTTFVSTLMSSLTAGIGTLVDADLDADSTRLQALQTKQSLGLQSLSIANHFGTAVLDLLQAARTSG